MKESAFTLFSEAYGADPAVTARAPGRIEFIGNHTDYNLGTVLGAAIDRHVTVALTPRDDGIMRFCSDTTVNRVELASFPGEKLRGRESWANYPLGVWKFLPEFGLPQPNGFDMAITTNLPSGAGLSSSAALEVAAGFAFAGAAGVTISREAVAALGRRAENEFVGVPCGILDQGTVVFGKKDHLVHIDCRGPAFSTIPLPSGLRFLVFNTLVKHSLVDSLYSTRHSECQNAARLLGVGHLADADPAILESHKGDLDPVSLRRARHVIGEIARVAAVRKALAVGNVIEVGRLLTESHHSSRDQFENSTPELDFLVAALTILPGVLGARLTGGGFGGAVLALVREDFPSGAASKVAGAYAAKFGNPPDVLELSTGEGAGLT